MRQGLTTSLCAVALVLNSGCALNSYHVPPALVIRPGENPADGLQTRAIKANDGPQARTIKANDGKAFTDKFLTAYNASYDLPIDPGKARELTRYGMTLIDLRCDLFFEQIGRGAQKTDFIRREFQSISAALVAALGLANVGADAVTAVGIGSAFGLQSIDNYSTVYFFSPEVSSVQQLVRRAFSSLRTEVLSPTASPQDFDAAIGALRTYQNVCTAHGIKRLVTEAVEKGETIAQYGNGDAPRFAEAVDRTLKAMAKSLGVDSISPREAVLIEMLVKNEPRALDAVEADYACQALGSDVRKKVCTDKKDPVIDIQVFALKSGGLDAATAQQLGAQWATLHALKGKDYDAEAATQIAVIKESAPLLREKRIANAKADADLAAAKQQNKPANIIADLTNTQQQAVQATQETVGASAQASEANASSQTLTVKVKDGSSPDR